MAVAIVQHARDDAPHCGDLAVWWEDATRTVLCIIDGLGHGPQAEQAATRAAEYVECYRDRPLCDILSGCNEAIRSTRGVAMGLVAIDREAGRLSYVGVGNTQAVFVGQTVQYLSNNHGIVGGGIRSLRCETLPLATGDLVILLTDGVDPIGAMSQVEIIARRDLSQLAEQILQRGRRPADDAAVLVYRNEAA